MVILGWYSLSLYTDLSLILMSFLISLLFCCVSVVIFCSFIFSFMLVSLNSELFFSLYVFLCMITITPPFQREWYGFLLSYFVQLGVSMAMHYVVRVKSSSDYALSENINEYRVVCLWYFTIISTMSLLLFPVANFKSKLYWKLYIR